MTGHAIVGDLLRGDTITGIDGRTIPAETVTRVETIGDAVAVTTKRGPQRRTTVRHLPATTPVTTDPPLPHWRFMDRRHEPSGEWKYNVGAAVAGAVLGLVSNRRPVDTSPIVDRRP